jgi:hypothetical protein
VLPRPFGRIPYISYRQPKPANHEYVFFLPSVFFVPATLIK